MPVNCRAIERDTAATASDRWRSASVSMNEAVAMRRVGCGSPRLCSAGKDSAGQQRVRGGQHPVMAKSLGHIASAGQGMVCPGNQVNRLAVQRGIGQIGDSHPFGHPAQGEVKTPRQNLIAQRIRGGDHDLETDVGVVLPLDLQGGQHPVKGRAGDRADADMADPASRDLGQIAGGVVKFDPDALGAQGKGAAQGGHPDPAARAFVDRVADDPLDLGHQTRGGGLRYPDGGSGLGQLACLGQRRQKAQVADLQPLAQQAVRGARRKHIRTGMISFLNII